MKLYDLTDREIGNSSLADLAKKAGYASLRAMANECGQWSATVEEVTDFLTEQIVTEGNQARKNTTKN